MSKILRSLYIEEDVWQKAKRLAKREGKSFSQEVESLILKELVNVKKELEND